ncbi:MFS transporter [Rhizohabitans arisaemae]|uniref:MFS transporter n=1 Tax=Rhizohabitans arisaemae TaxID=2720610 RepID=UPI0024B26299|nr:MFS transporter [Rhizohabitans arisaemae]
MRTYRELFRVPEFTPFFAVFSLYTAAMTIMSLAVATLVYTATGSPLLSALSMFGSSFAQVIGAMTLLSAADRLPPRRANVALAAVFALSTYALAVPGMPIWGTLGVIAVMGLVGSLGGGVRWGLLSDIVPDSGYVLARSTVTMAGGITQVVGLAFGGVLIATVSARSALLIAATLHLITVVVARFGLTHRPPRATGRPSVRATWQVNRILWSAPERRYLYLALWVPNGLIVGCEALFIPYAPESASILFIAAALGMFAGDMAMGRFIPPAWRRRLLTPARIVLAAPYLLFLLPMPLPIALIVVAVASTGFSACLILQERLLALVPEELRGQALGLHTSGMLVLQAVGATVAGAVAQYLAAGTAMAVTAAASLLVTLALIPFLRSPAQTPSRAEPIPA